MKKNPDITLNELATGAAGLWTDSGSVTYLTSLTDDLAIGGSLASDAPFFFDEGNELTLAAIEML